MKCTNVILTLNPLKHYTEHKSADTYCITQLCGSYNVKLSTVRDHTGHTKSYCKLFEMQSTDDFILIQPTQNNSLWICHNLTFVAYPTVFQFKSLLWLCDIFTINASLCPSQIIRLCPFPVTGGYQRPAFRLLADAVRSNSSNYVSQARLKSSRHVSSHFEICIYHVSFEVFTFYI